MFDAFEVKTGLKQREPLSPMFFYLALENAIREMQKKSTGIIIEDPKIQVLGLQTI